MKQVKFILFVFATVLSFSVSAQTLKAGGDTVKVSDLPEYVIITSENTKLLGGIGITIDYKKSAHRDELMDLEEMLQSGKKLRVRNQTDLLNQMSNLGFEYVNAYVGAADSDSSSYDLDKTSDYRFEDSKYRTNMVFRKKEKFRN